MLIRVRLLLLGIALLWLAPSAFGQAPEIGGLLPSGGLRGQTTKVRIDGKNLTGAQLHLSGGGIVTKSLQVTPNGEQLTAELAVESGARLGAHEVRITTPKGVSNGSRFWVDVVGNHVLEAPMQEGTPPLSLDSLVPTVINGRIATRVGRDRFTFTASAGDIWTFDCFADRIRSRFDPVMELVDEAGVNVRLAQSAWESDPRFCHKFTKAGRYFLTIRDSEYNGGSNYTYRLLVGRLPFLTHFSPRGGQPGSVVDITLQGTNVTAQRASVAIPADAPNGTYWAEVALDMGKPALIPLIVGNEQVLNNGANRAVQRLPALPVAVDGVFKDAPSARFSFHGTAQMKYLFDLLGRRIGSRIDGEIRILNAEGKEIASNDDAPGLGKEARLEFTAPATADYTVEVRNVEEMTGADSYYRLKVRQVVPDFALSIATDRLTVPQGGTATLPVTVERIGGFNGTVEVTLEGLPNGVTAPTLVFPPDKATLDVKLTATPKAEMSGSAIHLRGKATIGGKPVWHEAPAWEKYEHRSIDLLLSVEYSYTRPFHLWEMFLLGVTEPQKK